MAAKYKNPKAMLKKGQEYFDFCDKNEKPKTMVSLALYLGFSNRQSLYDYRKNPKFTEAIDYLKSRIEEYNTELLYETGMYEKRVNQGSVMFALKATLGLRDNYAVVESIAKEESKIDYSKIPADKLDEFISLLEGSMVKNDE